MTQNDIKQLTPDEFPPLLSEIPDPPKQLFLRGELPAPETKLLCVVGARKYSPYGKAVCQKLIGALQGRDVAIVSGLALGIDGIAHRSALEAGLKTVAVPGSGLDRKVLYPKTHAGLAQEIISAGGAHLSEFPNDHQARPESFPQRNRIMAGMSDATLIIEAGVKSGTLITARLALDYNRDVCTVPGSIFSESSRGSNKLMREGAFPITEPKDLFEILEIKNTEEGGDENPKDLTKEETLVFELLTEPISKEELLEKLQLPAHKANILLSAMEIKGLLKESMGKIMRNT